MEAESIPAELSDIDDRDDRDERREEGVDKVAITSKEPNRIA